MAKVYQEIGGLTNTLRVKHRVPLANLPKPGLPWSDSIRSCLIANGNEVMIGSDLSSIEDKVKFFYINPFDPDFVNIFCNYNSAHLYMSPFVFFRSQYI